MQTRGRDAVDGKRGVDIESGLENISALTDAIGKAIVPLYLGGKVAGWQVRVRRTRVRECF